MPLQGLLCFTFHLYDFFQRDFFLPKGLTKITDYILIWHMSLFTAIDLYQQELKP